MKQLFVINSQVFNKVSGELTESLVTSEYTENDARVRVTELARIRDPQVRMASYEQSINGDVPCLPATTSTRCYRVAYQIIEIDDSLLEDLLRQYEIMATRTLKVYGTIKVTARDENHARDIAQDELEDGDHMNDFDPDCPDEDEYEIDEVNED